MPRIRNALRWLKANNPLYAHIAIDENAFKSLENVSLATVTPTDADDKEAAAEGVGYAVLDALDNSDAEHSFVVGPTVPTLADRQSQLEVRYVVGCSASDRAL